MAEFDGIHGFIAFSRAIGMQFFGSCINLFHAATRIDGRNELVQKLDFILR